MTDRDIERKAIHEILKETELTKERKKPPENGLGINKRLLSRNLVSTLRNPVFPRHLRKRVIIGLDDETEDESDSDHNRRKNSSSRNRFAEDDYIYDARDYFNPEKYREIVAYRNKKHQIQECYERKRNPGYVVDSTYMPTVRKNNYDEGDKWQYRELQDYENEEHEADAEDEKVLTISRTDLCIFENTNNARSVNHQKKKHRKSKCTCTHSQEKTHSRKLKYKQDKKCRKCKKYTTRIKKARHKKKMAKKQKKSTYTSDTEFRELNQPETENFKKFRSDNVRNGSPCSSHFANEDSSFSMQSTVCYNGNQSKHSDEGDISFKAEQFVSESGVSYEGSSLVSAKYLNELYFRTRQSSDYGESRIH